MKHLENLWNFLFPMPTPNELVQEELQEAQRQLLAAQSAQEHAAAMVSYNRNRVARLQAVQGKLDTSRVYSDRLCN